MSSCHVQWKRALDLELGELTCTWIWWTIGANHSIKLDFTCKMKKLALDIFKALVWGFFCLIFSRKFLSSSLFKDLSPLFGGGGVGWGGCVYLHVLGMPGFQSPRQGISSVTQAGRFPELLSYLQSEKAMRMIILTLLVSQGCVRIKWDNSCENILKIK